MKKLWNSILVSVLIVFCMLTCMSHLANKFFIKDIGTIVIGEINLKQHIQTLFEQIEIFVPDLDRDAFLNLKDEIENNAEANRIVGEASKDMLNDIVNGSTTNQDMKAVLKDLLYSYDNEIEKVLEPLVTKDQIHEFIDQGITYTPIQEVYDITVDSFQESIPTSYMKMMKFVNFISQEIIFIGSAIGAILIVMVLMILNRHRFKWCFSVGMGGVISGVALLIIGQIIPRVYQSMLGKLDYVVSSISNEDFQLITNYGIGYMVIGVCCLGSYFLISRKKNERRGSV
ncbi:MAG: hypothetical protein RR690_04130 [Longicatena sp.]